MPKILITGACGHIGSYLIHNLPSYEIIAIDNMQRNRYCSLFHLPSNVTFIEKSFVEIPHNTLNGVDIVLHLAALTDATTSIKYEMEFEETNVKLTRRFVQMCKSKQVPLFIFPSSCSVYGVSTEEVFEDNTKYLNPQSPYAETKLAIEENITYHLGNTVSKYLILRLGTIFGTSMGMRFETAINRFCYETRFNKPLRLWRESYHMKRPYLGLSDLLQAITLLVNKPQSWNHTYNVITLNESCDKIIEYIETIAPVEKNWVDTPLLNQYNYTVNSDKIKSLGFKPTANLKQSIENTIRLRIENNNV